MSKFWIYDIPCWCHVLLKIISCEYVKDAQIRSLVFAPIWTGAKIYALVIFFLAIQQNKEYLIGKWREFFNSLQIAVK
jgi:hypothetical protein